MSTIRVQTTQNVTLEYEVASVGERIVANIVDTLIIIGWAVAWVLLLTLLDIKEEAMFLIVALLVGLPYMFYHLLCEILFNGQSLGKKARHIKVIRLDGTPPRIGDYLLRWVLRIVDMGFMGGLVAVIVILANGKGQRVGDLAAGTCVVSTRPRQNVGSLLAPDLTDVNYVVVFPQAALLADHDVATIRQLLAKGLERDNYLFINEVANRVKQVTGVQTDLNDEAFLRTILRDHAHLAAQGS
ncbi:RDD family protein [Hymenobacter chitinivorans]|uniref:Putative RDD family membrane protein YckC n=1 Tax=Hymenobacter chitinivorans DSM 11115 TaxID=1121954 RepID=A0A2M9AQL3_9BACT|nr:RDD family protein [Hymenobacter chitinivorans]PJJ47994.1 putative RDD family membrane protein YckC [Hymenobacter chitinivorans DSM 11115]